MPRAIVEPRIRKIMHSVDEDKAHLLGLELTGSFTRSDTQVMDIGYGLDAGLKRSQISLRSAIAIKGSMA